MDGVVPVTVKPLRGETTEKGLYVDYPPRIAAYLARERA
jgi:hypothetical protein